MSLVLKRRQVTAWLHTVNGTIQFTTFQAGRTGVGSQLLHDRCSVVWQWCRLRPRLTASANILYTFNVSCGGFEGRFWTSLEKNFIEVSDSHSYTVVWGVSDLQERAPRSSGKRPWRVPCHHSHCSHPSSAHLCDLRLSSAWKCDTLQIEFSLYT